MTTKQPAPEQQQEVLKILKQRFDKNMNRHNSLAWENVLEKLLSNPEKLYALQQMELSGGEPDVVGYDESSGHYIFFDCSAETPKGRRSLCYDREALDSRKEHKPVSSAVEMANEMGIELLDEQQYRELQKLGPFDTKTSSWLKTPAEVRELGGALFGDFRYGRVFIYHNGASSYYAVRGFRGCLRV